MTAFDRSMLDTVYQWLFAHRITLAVSIVFFVVTLGLFAVVGLGVAWAIVAAVTMSYVFVVAKRMNERHLKRRIEAAGGPVWRVFVNDVDVGSLRDGEFAALQLQTLNDLRVYVWQLGNLVHVLLHIALAYIRFIPLGLLFFVAACAVFSPDELALILSNLQNTTAQDIEGVVAVLSQYSVVVVFLYCTVGPLFGVSLGFVNRFRVDTGRRIRQQLSIAAEGDIRLYSGIGFARMMHQPTS